jgi:hypothetical protein
MSVQKGEMTAHQASHHYGIKSPKTVYRWIALTDEIFCSTFVKINPKMSEKKEETRDELKAELAAIRKLLDYERLRSESYLTMIKLAEEKFGFPIEKKSGTKQSK